MQTLFASAERADNDELQRQVDFASHNPIIDALLKTVGGGIAVLNEHRQVLAVNEALLAMLPAAEASAVFGLRPGEAIECVHAQDAPGGCGTGRYCSTCGAALAIVASLETDRPQERTCAATVRKNGAAVDLCFKIRTCPITFDQRRFILLFLQDITAQHHLASLERIFFHDISNIITALRGTCELFTLIEEHEMRAWAAQIQKQVSLLAKEVSIQRALSEGELHDYRPLFVETPLSRIVQDIKNLFAHHPVTHGRSLILPESVPDVRLSTDVSLLLRVLTNMLINAFEATDAGGEVRMWVALKRDTVTFCVWNRVAIPEEVALRIFQQHFSTKDGSGRGLGTYAMQLIGETLLGGKVAFETSADHGTTFRLQLKICR